MLCSLSESEVDVVYPNLYIPSISKTLDDIYFQIPRAKSGTNSLVVEALLKAHLDMWVAARDRHLASSDCLRNSVDDPLFCDLTGLPLSSADVHRILRDIIADGSGIHADSCSSRSKVSSAHVHAEVSILFKMPCIRC